jgi:catechol 2,3-dioxygenase-like lactoylglutathione lyase family enzyme
MGFHHVAFASRDTEATHRFYTEAMGFRLDKVVVGASPEGGWAKHFFYDTGGNGMIAFWELHDADNAKIEGVKTAISKDLDLPSWVNHLAFDAATLDDISVARDRWLKNGYDVVEIDHEFCVSIYTDDPNGILVEFCCTTREFDDNDRAEAQQRLLLATPDLDPDPKVQFHMAADYAHA